jgi:beta-1,4-mannooligosaccharide phosphorylase/Double zinc ribbon
MLGPMNNGATASCPSCGHANRGAKFCDQCGTPLPVRVSCGDCGHANVDAKFCERCGKALTGAGALNPYAPPADTADDRPGDSEALPLASRGARLGATLIDAFCVSVVNVPLLFAFGFARMRTLLLAAIGPLACADTAGSDASMGDAGVTGPSTGSSDPTGMPATADGSDGATAGDPSAVSQASADGGTTSADAGSSDATSGSSDGATEGTTGAVCPAPPAALPSGPLTRFRGNPLLRNGPESYDFGKTGPRVVRREGDGDYRIWYEAVDDDIYTTVGFATSDDGLAWTKIGVVLSPSAAWEGNEVSPNSILVEDGTYELWYHAGGSQLVNRRIGYATSPDGMSWTKLADPVLDLGAGGAFDDDQVAEPRVFRLDDGYRMYYTGRNQATNQTSLGMATSDDGIVWTKYDDSPVIDAGVWGNFWGGAFFFEDEVWHLWHGVTDGDISQLEYMWSTDGIVWNDGPNNPVLSQNPDEGAADYGLVGDSVSGYRDGDTYRIMYTGFNWDLFGSQGRFEGICLASVDAAC